METHLRQALETAEAARSKAVGDAETETRRALVLQASQANTSVAHLEAMLQVCNKLYFVIHPCSSPKVSSLLLLQAERQSRARVMEETRQEASAAATRIAAEHDAQVSRNAAFLLGNLYPP